MQNRSYWTIPIKVKSIKSNTALVQGTKWFNNHIYVYMYTYLLTGLSPHPPHAVSMSLQCLQVSQLSFAAFFSLICLPPKVPSVIIRMSCILFTCIPNPNPLFTSSLLPGIYSPGTPSNFIKLYLSFKHTGTLLPIPWSSLASRVCTILRSCVWPYRRSVVDGIMLPPKDVQTCQ